MTSLLNPANPWLSYLSLNFNGGPLGLWFSFWIGDYLTIIHILIAPGIFDSLFNLRGLDLPYKKHNIIFCDIKSRKEIDTLIFIRNLSNIAIGEICWESTGIKKIENLDADKKHNRSNNWSPLLVLCLEIYFLNISITQRDDSFHWTSHL